ncbi:MAG: hypothetical protein RQ866_00140, partial [Bacteroidales bacterium]|nr:hypothetical protein [Bacteroidales bacterium]
MIIRIRNAYCYKNNTTLLIFFSLVLFSPIKTTAQITNYIETERSNAPRQIEPLSNTQHSSDWYKQQAEAWNSEVTSASTNATAWYNYYTAQRFAVYNKESGDISTDGKRKLNNIVDEMETLIPGSFEFNYIKYWNGENDTALYPYLIKAYKINPYRTETY